MNASPYPLVQPVDYNFGMLPPLIRAAARAVSAAVVEADPLLVRTHLLSVISSALNPLYTVAPPGWSPIPVGVNTLCVAKVGGSKSPVHDLLVVPLRRHVRESLARFESAFVEYEALKTERKFEIDGIEAEIRRRRRTGDSLEGPLAELSLLNRATIKAPKHRPRLAVNVDLEGMFSQLDGNGEAIDFLTDEGDRFLSGSLMRHVADLVDLIDGKPMEFRRERKKHLYASQPSGTFGLMVQPGALEPFRPRIKGAQYIEHKAAKLGFFARFLICVASSMPQGNGYATTNGDGQVLSELHATLQGLYDSHRDRLEAGVVERTELLLAPDAIEYWEELCRITTGMKIGQWSHIADFVSKMLNLTARLAAVLHVLESETRFISTSALQRAWDLVCWHRTQYEFVFAPPPPPPQQEADVLAVIDHLTLSRFSLSLQQVPTEPIGLLLALPNNRLRAALLRMEQRGLIEPCKEKPGFINCQGMFSRSRNITWR